jgi:two-component system sensor histidine kinase SenX3
MKQGAQDFLPKPFTSDELLTVVQRGIAERQRRLALKQQMAREEETLQLERARQEMAKLDAIESRFMLVIVHELRNPAGVIKNYLQLLRSGYVDEDEWDEYLKKLDLRAGQLLNMLDDLLELAHLKGRHGAVKPRPVAVADILEGVAAQFRSAAEAKGLDLKVQIHTRPTMMAEAAHLQSLWRNLIDNAIRYTPSGRVSVTLSEKEGQIVAAVSDTGIGVSTEELTRIFQEFYRSDGAKQEVELGTGLGLPIANQVIKIYGGRIEVDSVPGQGSTFTVSFPLVAS